MFCGYPNKNDYIAHMEALSRMCREIHDLHYGYEYTQGIKAKKLHNFVSRGIVGIAEGFVSKCKSAYGWHQIRKNEHPIVRNSRPRTKPDYFSNERIAVYTCIFGKYDSIQRPMCYPDNIDYYIITDMDIDEGCGWKKYDINDYEDQLREKSNVEKNRWFKMHPHEVFKEYKYSVYVDGNIIPVTDFTEFVNQIGSCGVAMYWHSPNNCIYQEALQNKYIIKKISPEEVDRQVAYLRHQGMPEDYGMTTCNVIARDHTNPICIKLMNDWWREFFEHCRRDQLSFPYVAWMNSVPMEDIAVLGDDVWRTDALLVIQHTT